MQPMFFLFLLLAFVLANKGKQLGGKTSRCNGEVKHLDLSLYPWTDVGIVQTAKQVQVEVWVVLKFCIFNLDVLIASHRDYFSSEYRC